MNVDLTDLLIAIVPSIITAIISYLGATKKSNSEIFAVKEATKRELESIKADTDREIEKIKADTEREIEKIQAQTDSQIKLMEAESKSKESEKLSEMMFEKFGPKLFDPDNLGKLLELGEDPSNEEIRNFLKTIK
ncbi:hypothetical protein AAK882_02640 [Carnobacteriaceae bacterium 52-44]